MIHENYSTANFFLELAIHQSKRQAQDDIVKANWLTDISKMSDLGDHLVCDGTGSALQWSKPYLKTEGNDTKKEKMQRRP